MNLLQWLSNQMIVKVVSKSTAILCLLSPRCDYFWVNFSIFTWFRSNA